MRMDNIGTSFVLILLLTLTVAQNVHGATKLGISRKDIASSKNLRIKEPVKRDKNKTIETDETPEDDEQGLIDIYSGHGHKARGLSSRVVLARQRRSMLTNQEETNSVDRLRELLRAKRILSDYGYGSRLQAGENIANSYAREGLFGVAGPGKRSAELADLGVLNDNTEEAKRIDTDYGYGSRVQAAENVAMDWDRNGLFGIMGPGKRYDISKRLSTDFGFGSRLRAAENAASSDDGLFGLHRPGKRNSAPGYEIPKRFLSDYGYGSRLQAAENIAQSSTKGGLFGLHGPGKRNIQGNEMLVRLPDQEGFRKRIDSDFGYGSREQAAENLAKSLGKNKIFGIYGPGKRSRVDFVRNTRGGETMDADSGYGSRIQAGSQIANDVVAINDLFGSFGPGRRKRSMDILDKLN